MGRRQSIEVAGAGHKSAPIPMAARVGGLLMSSGISGTDPSTGDLPDDAQAQTLLIFQHIRAILESAGGSPADLVHVRFFVRERDDRRFINPEWLEMFPDPEDRPARHVLVYDLPGQMLVQAEITAMIEVRA